jgi:hypothetical protein
MTAIVLRADDQAEIRSLGEALAQSGYFRTGEGRDSQAISIAQAAVAIIAGRELGLGPVEALRSFHFTTNGVQPSADLLARLVRRHPRYDYSVVELSDEVAELAFFDRALSEHPQLTLAGRSRFTIEDAKRAGLGIARDGKTTAWQKYPRNMLFSRAMTNGVAWFAPDVIDALITDPDPEARVAALAGDPEGSPFAGGEPDLPGEGSDEGRSSMPGSPIAYGEGAGRDDPPDAGLISTDAASGGSGLDLGTPPAEDTGGSVPDAPDAGAESSPDERPEGYKEALWSDLWRVCSRVGQGPIAALNAANPNAHFTLSTTVDDVTVEQLEAAFALIPEEART